MNLSFDPRDAGQCETAIAVISFIQSGAKNFDAPKTEPTVADSGGASEAPATTSDPNLIDAMGMPHNPAYHQTPPAKKANGDWKMKRGKGDEYEAAVVAHKAAQAAAEAGTTTATEQEDPAAPVDPLAPRGNQEMGGMPAPGGSMPAPGGMPAPGEAALTPPPTPLSYEVMAKRFMAAIEQGLIDDYEAAYEFLSIDYDSLASNQSQIRRIWAYIDALEAGRDDDAAISHALTAVPV